jgi:signal peptidase II
MSRRALLVFGLLLGTVGCDQGTKALAVSALRDGPARTYLGGLIRLFYAENRGAFGSLGAHWPEPLKLVVFVGLPILVLGGVLVRTLRDLTMPLRQVVALALIVAGGAGNLIDRVRHGYVVDFMYVGVGRVGTNVFNVADVALMVGIGLLLLDGVRRRNPSKAA